MCGVLSCELATDDFKIAGLGTHANNNASESSSGRLIEQITKSSVIGLTYAGEMSMTRRNLDFTVDSVCTSNKSKVIRI